MRYLGGNRKNSAKNIVFTHPDEKALRDVYNFFSKQKNKERITSQISMLPFELALDSALALQDVQKVFVCYTMGQDDTVDKRIISEWAERETLGGRLIHLGGRTKLNRRSVGDWAEPKLYSYVSPEDIVKWQKTRKSQNDAVIKLGKTACNTCAEVRSENQRPTSKIILSNLVNPAQQLPQLGR